MVLEHGSIMLAGRGLHLPLVLLSQAPSRQYHPKSAPDCNSSTSSHAPLPDIVQIETGAGSVRIGRDAERIAQAPGKVSWQ